MHPALDAEGQTYRDFLITKRLELKELRSTLLELVHEPSGARVMHIATSDPDNLFCLSFQTLPDSSNGVAHILEHTVLCGSERFPIKDPFFSMTRRSLNTYMNALTGPDFTCYPASSQVEKDFYNLLEVYLDAVFRPQLKYLSFLQEGHRLAFAEKGSPDSPLVYQGVVYNEMKGSMSSVDSRLSFHLYKHLIPDLPYAYNSGGDPGSIPNLTHKELVEFHRSFYHPSRCLFFFYGNIPLSRHLDFIEKRALNNAQKIALLDPLPLQPRFSAPRTAVERYPIAEPTPASAIVAIALLTAPISSQQDLLALSLLDLLLMDNDGSELKSALLKSELLKTAESSLDLEMSEAPWALICKGCEPDAAAKIEQLVFSTLENIAAAGFDPEEIESCLHQIEFDRTEIGGEGMPFGLSLFFRAGLIKQHGADPESSLLIHSLFATLRKHLEHPDYLPDLIRRYFLSNPHRVTLTLIGDPQLEAEEKKLEEHRLLAIRASLGKAETHTLLEQEKRLDHYQEEIERQSLDCLPNIGLKDVPSQAKDYPIAKIHQPIETFHHACFTNRIVYADAVFDLPGMASGDGQMFSFLTKALTEIGCGKRTYEETLALQQSCVGEFGAAASLFIQHDDPGLAFPAVSLRGNALFRNAPKFFSLLEETIAAANFRDSERIADLLAQHATSLSSRLTKQSMSYATGLALSGLSLPASIYHQWQGLSYYQTIQEWAKSKRDLSEPLDQLYQKLFHTQPAFVLSCDEEECKELRCPPFAKLARAKRAPIEGSFAKVQHQGRIIAAPVAFTAFAFPGASYRHPDSPFLMIATQLLENVILHKEIREKGGAYGAGASYSPATGHFHFFSYRDPHLYRTYTIFLKAAEKIASKEFTDQELEEAKLSVLQTLDAPAPPGQRASIAYTWMRSGRTFERRNAFRRSILNATPEDIANAVETHVASQSKSAVLVSFAGADLLKKDAPEFPFPFEILSV